MWDVGTGKLLLVFNASQKGRLIYVSEETDVEAEIGDLLFSIVNLARKIGCDPRAALDIHRTHHRLQRRDLISSGHHGLARRRASVVGAATWSPSLHVPIGSDFS